MTKDTTAATNGGKLLRNTEVKSYIDERLQEISDVKTANAKEVMEYLTAVMRGKSQAETVVVESVGDGISSATRILKNPDEKEKLKAAELLGKRFGLFDGDKSKATQDVLNKLDEVLADGMLPQLRRFLEYGRAKRSL